MRVASRPSRFTLPLILVVALGASKSEPAASPSEITVETPLLHADGTVAAHGWARGPLMQYDRSLVQADHLPGLREWEYYAVFAPDFAIGLTLADLGFLSFAILTLEDYATGDVHDAMLFGDAAGLDFPSTPFENTLFESSAGSIEYRFEEGMRTITVLAGEEGGDERMEAHLQLSDSRATQSIAVVHRFEEPGQFFYENKRLSMPATGSVQVGDASYTLPEGQSFAVLDWGRGAWPGEVRWEWGHFAGMNDGQLLGINMGTVNGDDTPGTADAAIVDGVLHKLGRSAWEYDLEDVMAPWRFSSADGSIDLTLTPDFDDSTTLDLGAAYVLTRWKVHGEIEGAVRLDDGSQLQVQGIRGAAEYVEIIW
ncbi:MAG: DUF2804 domain-containing protein [Polyangiales bacterium]